jgi:hypothetical protein
VVLGLTRPIDYFLVAIVIDLYSFVLNFCLFVEMRLRLSLVRQIHVVCNGEVLLVDAIFVLVAGSDDSEKMLVFLEEGAGDVTPPILTHLLPILK